jgi:hypothetical protein
MSVWKRFHWPSAAAFLVVAMAGVLGRQLRRPAADWRLLGTVAGDSVWIDVGAPLSRDGAAASWSLARWDRRMAKPGTFATVAHIDCATRRLVYGRMPVGAEQLAPIAIDTVCALTGSRAR